MTKTFYENVPMIIYADNLFTNMQDTQDGYTYQDTISNLNRNYNKYNKP